MSQKEIIEENKRVRLKLLSVKKNHDKGVILRKCKEDVVFFINHFCWGYDPRLSEPNVPFILYPKQELLIKKLDEYYVRSQNGEIINLLIDKPRDVGATFAVMNWILHKFLFFNFSARVGSRKESFVDTRGSSDTLFFKLDYTLDKLPSWITGGYNPDTDRTSMTIRNNKNKNSIEGESSNPDFGRGGRKSVTLFDELGFWDWASAAWRSCGSSSFLKIAMSTPPRDGRDSFYYKLLTGREGDVERFDFDWDDVPGRDEKWLELQRRIKSSDEFASDVMKSYDGSVEGKVYANDMKFVTVSEIEYNPNLPLFVSWDFGLDSVAMIWWQKDFTTNRLYIIDSYSNSNQDISFFLPMLGLPIQSTYTYNRYDLDVIERHKHWRRDTIHYGDPSVKQRHLSTGESTLDLLQRKYSIYIQSKDWAGRKWTDLRDITRTVFRRLEINGKKCESLIYAMRNARYPKKKEGSQAVSEPLRPIHDMSTSHYRSSFEYFCDCEPENFFMNDTDQEEDFDPYSIF